MFARVAFALLALGVSGLFALMLARIWAPAHSGVDQNGYLVGGKMFADHFSTGMTPPDIYSFVGRMWIEAPDGQRFYPKYPIGLPILYAVALWAGGTAGTTWAYLVSPVTMTLALVGCWMMLRLVARPYLAVLGLILLAASPALICLGNNPNSHASTLFCVAWGMYLLLRYWQSGGYWHAIGAGFLLGYAVTIRYTEGLLILPLALVVLYRREWRTAGALVGAWLVPVLVLVLFNWRAFGHLTGYDPTNESTGFTLEYLAANWEVMARQLGTMGLFFVLPLSVAGLVWMFWVNWRLALLLGSWIVPSIVVYTAYYWAPDTQSVGYVRFFVTILPGLALCAMWMAQQLETAGAPRAAVSLSMGCIVAISAAVGAAQARTPLEQEHRSMVAAEQLGRLVLAQAPAGSLIFAPDDRSLCHLQFVGDWRLYSGEQFSRRFIQNLGERLDPDEPQGLQPQRALALYERLKGSTESELIGEQNSLMSAAFGEKRRVFALVTRQARDLFRLRAISGRKYQMNVVAEWSDPAETRREVRRRWSPPPAFLRFFNRPGTPGAPGQTWQLVEIRPR